MVNKKKSFGKPLAPAKPKEAADPKWIGAIGAHAANMEGRKTVLAKYIPLNYIIPDPDNCRELSVSSDLLVHIVKIFPLQPQWLKDDSDTLWQDCYIDDVAKHFELTDKALIDFISIVEQAGSLKRAERLINPIAVIQSDSTFNLIAGERRYLAHVLLAEKQIAATIFPDGISRQEIDTMQWEENVDRQDMRLIERLNRVGKLSSYEGGIENVSVRRLANIIGKSVAESQRYKAVLSCKYPELLEAIRTGKIADLKRAAALAQLSKKELLAKLSDKAPKEMSKPLIKLNPKTNIDAVKTIVYAAAEKLDLHQHFEDDITSVKDAGASLEKLLQLVMSNNGR